jgi:hypothetical protein
VDIQFLNKIPGVVILNKDSTMSIVCADTFIKVLGSKKYSQEFIEIWETKSAQCEKWILVEEHLLSEEIGEEILSLQIMSTV